MFQILGHMNISSFKPHANFTSAPILEGNFKRTVQPAPFVVVQSLSRIWLFATPWSATCQASLSITNSLSLLRFMSIVLVMPSNQLIFCHPLLFLPSIFPSIRVFTSGDWSIGASASVFPMNIQDLFPLGWTGWISLQSKELSRVSSNTQFKNINSLAFSLLYGPALTSIHDY